MGNVSPGGHRPPRSHRCGSLLMSPALHLPLCWVLCHFDIGLVSPPPPPHVSVPEMQKGTVPYVTLHSSSPFFPGRFLFCLQKLLEAPPRLLYLKPHVPIF